MAIPGCHDGDGEVCINTFSEGCGVSGGSSCVHYSAAHFPYALILYPFATMVTGSSHVKGLESMFLRLPRNVEAERSLYMPTYIRKQEISLRAYITILAIQIITTTDGRIARLVCAEPKD